jgi:tripartite-type tricarboxylate transporter receptor subunit TctC
MRVDRRSFVAGGLASVAAAGRAPAQTSYPNRAVRVIVPFPAGGTTDLLARLVSERLQTYWGQPFVVENVGGAGGSLGADRVAKAAPDGYTLLFHNLTFSTTSVSLEIAGRATHDMFRDFRPVSLAAHVPMIVLGRASGPTGTLADFVTAARQSSESALYGSTGPGSVMNFAMEVFRRDSGLKLDHVPFRGAAPLLQELVAGRLHLGGDQLSTSLEFIRSGAVRPLATLSNTRPTALPDVPTVRELGFPNMEMQGWNGFFAPAATPDDIVNKLEAGVKRAMQEPELRTRLLALGADPIGSTPAEFLAVLRRQVDGVRPLIAELKLVVQ